MQNKAIDITKPQYPFSAVCGQSAFKLALTLAAINPAMGGVVISGPRGSAKSTLARGMAALLDDAEFVTLPLGASEEMLLGTLDLQQVLHEKKLAFSPGLLSKAHAGVLYVDEVNLLPDNLVDLLLDVSTSGVNRVERDGISHSHAAEFILVGTMNPDEGELRPQLHDRFGLSVQLNNQYQAAERVEIVKRREQFEADPQAFSAAYQTQQQDLIAAIKQARQLLPQVQSSDELRLVIAERCEQAQVDGLRADIVWFRAAKAHAALAGRTELSMQDVDAVAELVLAHRRKAQSPEPPASSQPSQKPPSGSSTSADEEKPSPFRRPENSYANTPQSSQQHSLQQQSSQQKDNQENASSQTIGEWGAMPAQQQKTAALNPLDLSSLPMRKRYSEQSLRPKQHAQTASHRPDWFKTLINNLPAWPPRTLKFKRQLQGQERLHLVLLDTSASTLQAQSFAYAKAALLQVSEQAYLQRHKIAVFGFGNNQVEHLLSSVRAPKALQQWLDALGAGGGTPMRDAFVAAQDYIRRLQQQQPQLDICCYILSDGRSSSSLQGIALTGQCVWIDTEMSSIKRGRGRQLAEQIKAIYLSLSAAMLTTERGAPA